MTDPALRVLSFGPDESGDYPGSFVLCCTTEIRRSTLRIIATDGGGWDHVSVSIRQRCPRWFEMQAVHRLFFLQSEAAMQLHVPVSDHINIHSNCLHLWRPQSGLHPIPLPPKEFV